MTEHTHNDFQFLDVLRKEPKRKALGKRKENLLKSIISLNQSELQNKLNVVLTVATPIVNGNVLFTTTFLTG